MVFIFGYRLNLCMLSYVLIVFCTRNTIRPRQSFQVALMQLSKFIKTYGLRLSTILTANEVKDKPATVVNGEGATAFAAFGFNLMSHF